MDEMSSPTKHQLLFSPRTIEAMEEQENKERERRRHPGQSNTGGAQILEPEEEKR